MSIKRKKTKKTLVYIKYILSLIYIKLNIMKKQTSFLKFLKAIILPVAFVGALISCNNDDDNLSEDPTKYYFSTTSHYGAKTDSTQVRTDAVGKWYDENNNLLVDINKGYKNPDYPYIIKDGVRIPKSYYAYDITSNVEGYKFTEAVRVEEGSLSKNNINLSGMFHLIVEGNTGYLWVMRNQPYVVKVKKQ